MLAQLSGNGIALSFDRLFGSPGVVCNPSLFIRSSRTYV
jgi:hypothetical protein